MDQFKHGLSGYIYRKCRCELCKAAMSEYHSGYHSTPGGKADHIRYSTSPKGKVAHNRASAKAYATPEGSFKQKARTAVNHAISSGLLKRSACLHCGNPRSHGHHEDYAKLLEVEWMCAKHHKEFHKWRD